MGRDSCIFAEKAKKALYFDREYNYLTWFEPYDPVAHHIVSRLQAKDKVLWEDAVYLAEHNIRGWAKEDADDPISALTRSNSHRVEWNKEILRFITDHPGDRFFVISDHSEPSFHDYARENGFTIYNGDYNGPVL